MGIEIDCDSCGAVGRWADSGGFDHCCDMCDGKGWLTVVQRELKARTIESPRDRVDKRKFWAEMEDELNALARRFHGTH